MGGCGGRREGVKSLSSAYSISGTPHTEEVGWSDFVPLSVGFPDPHAYYFTRIPLSCVWGGGGLSQFGEEKVRKTGDCQHLPLADCKIRSFEFL